MFLKLLILFIGFPMLEMMILIKLGAWLGLTWTLVIVFGTGLLGAALARLQGFRIWHRIHSELNAGRVPAEDMLDGVLVFIAGVVLITPGLLTDIAGLVILIPQTRFLLKRWMRKKFDEVMARRDGGDIQWRYFIT